MECHPGGGPSSSSSTSFCSLLTFSSEGASNGGNDGVGACGCGGGIEFHPGGGPSSFSTSR